MKRFVLSAFSVLIAMSAAAPQAKAFSPIDPNFDLQTLRLNNLDVRNKYDDSEKPFNIHKLRVENLEQRNKASLNTVPLMEQRYRVLDRHR